MEPCLICGTRNANFYAGPGPTGNGRECPRCGTFCLIGTAADVLTRLMSVGEINRSVFSHRLRVRYDASSRPVVLYEDDLRVYVGDYELPNPQQQADNLVLWIGRTQESPEGWARATPSRLSAIVGTSISVTTADEPGLSWLLNQIPKELYSRSEGANGSEITFQLKMAGWRSYETLRKTVATGHLAFMAMKFNESVIAGVLDTCFKPAALRAGFTLRALNELQPAGLIDNQIRAAIRSARFVIADLSDDNNGAYFEAGFAEGIGSPVIYTCESKKFAAKKTHFDTNHMHTIPWDLTKLDEAGRLLTATIRATLPGESLFGDA